MSGNLVLYLHCIDDKGRIQVLCIIDMSEDMWYVYWLRDLISYLLFGRFWMSVETMKQTSEVKLQHLFSWPKVFFG